MHEWMCYLPVSIIDILRSLMPFNQSYRQYGMFNYAIYYRRTQGGRDSIILVAEQEQSGFGVLLASWRSWIIFALIGENLWPVDVLARRLFVKVKTLREIIAVYQNF